MTTERTQKNKALIWEYWQKPPGVDTAFVHKSILWHGPHPINHLEGADALSAGFWSPLLESFPDIQRDTYIFFGAQDWVCGTGYFTGTFAQEWLGIPATGREAHIQFGEFCRLEDGKIAESYVLLDLIDVMRQAGFYVLPPSAGAEGMVPGPRANDGVLLDPQDDAESRKTQKLVDDMIDGLMRYDGVSLPSMNMVAYWDPQMQWYGPCGIGACHSLKEFEDFHQAPFLRAFPDRQGGNHQARLAEGLYVASAGWPSLHATHAADWLGCPPTQETINMRVMDFWKREGDVLVENWVFIDIVDTFLQSGVDLFDRLAQQVSA